MLAGSKRDGLRLGGLDAQNDWYTRVSESSGILPETADDLLAPQQFPKRFANQLLQSLCIYEAALEDPNLIGG